MCRTPAELPDGSAIRLTIARGISATPAQVAHARKGIVRNLRALVARSLWNGNGYQSVMNEDDSAVQEALRVLEVEK